MEEELISVIVPVFNDEAHIERCIRSIMCQTYNTLEIIIVDDGSTDDTLRICNQILMEDERVFLIREKHKGVCAARGHAIRCAKGKYIGFVDSDDWIEPDFFQVLHNEIKEFDMVGCAYKRHEFGKEYLVTEKCGRKEYKIQHIEEFYNDIMYPGKSISPMLWNKLFKMSILKGEFEKVRTDLHMASDAVLTYLSVLKCKCVKIIDESKYHYVMNKDSITESEDDCFLGNVNSFYLNLKVHFEIHYLADILIDNLKCYVMEMIRNRINYKLNIPLDYRIPNYYYPYFGRFEGMKIVLYGAGEVGKEYYRRMLRDRECEIVMWVDKQYKKYQKEHLPVKSPEEIVGIYYDAIVIGVKDRHICESIKQDLLNSNIDAEKIIWNKTKALWE